VLLLFLLLTTTLKREILLELTVAPINLGLKRTDQNPQSCAPGPRSRKPTFESTDSINDNNNNYYNNNNDNNSSKNNNNNKKNKNNDNNKWRSKL
jgi:DMSO/TMAO reductase YedYZ molybdopterin-dependent catalytic subunit